MKTQKVIKEQKSELNILDVALNYAEDGFYVFPLTYGEKYPIKDTNGHNGATTDRDTVLKMFKNQKRNLGIATGKKSGFFVLDIDGEEGEASLQELVDEFGELPATVELKTGKGRHLLFIFPGDKEIRNSTSKVAKNIDIRGDGGYIVAPPSMHPNGNRYEGEIDPEKISAAPSWLISQILWKKRAKGSKGKKGAKGSADILEGTRNDTLFSECLKLRRKGLDDDKALDALLTINTQRCKPPLEEAELERIVKSAYSMELEDTTEKFLGTTAEQEGLTDMGNSQRLREKIKKEYIYCSPLGGWQKYKNGRWVTDKTNSVVEEVKQATIDFVAEAEAVEDPSLRKKYLDFARSSQSNAKITAALKLTCSALSVETDDFDADPTMLNLANGVLDLKNEEIIEEHHPQQMLRKQTPVEFNEDAKCPRWEQFLNEVTGRDQELILYIQSVVGYCLTAQTCERCIFIFYGNGANGKTTFLNTIQQLLGDYAMTTPADTLMVKRTGGIPNDVARLYGARLVIASEGEMGQSLAEALVKRLTGQDVITARFLNQEFFEYTPTFKILFASNHIPHISGCDEGIWDRIRLIPFEVRIPEENREPDLANQLEQELSGILNWAIAGFFSWSERGLVTPESVVTANKDYRAEMDIVGNFMEANVVSTTGSKIQSSRLHQKYCQYCSNIGERSETQKGFSLILKNRGVISKKIQGCYYWIDIKIKHSQSVQEDEQFID